MAAKFKGRAKKVLCFRSLDNPTFKAVFKFDVLEGKMLRNPISFYFLHQDTTPLSHLCYHPLAENDELN